MKQQTKRFLSFWREKRPLFTTIGTTGGFAVTVLFALYNGGLGIWHSSLWHGSICIYYILLSLLRGILLATERKAGRKTQKAAQVYRKKVFVMTSGMVLTLNVALATPVSLMVLNRRPIQTGLISAIASAAYTTYKVIAAAVGWSRAKGTILQRELGVLRLVDALASVLVLQNTLIVAVDGGISPRIFQLAAISSAGILLLILAISVVWFARGLTLCRNGENSTKA